MSRFVAEAAGGALRTYRYRPDPRYRIRGEWVARRDGTRSVRYRAYFGHCTIGELAPSFRRETVMEELREMINAGGVGVMTDLPDPRKPGGEGALPAETAAPQAVGEGKP